MIEKRDYDVCRCGTNACGTSPTERRAASAAAIGESVTSAPTEA